MDLSELKKQQTADVKRHPWEITRSHIIAFLVRKACPTFNHVADIGSGDAYVVNELITRSIAASASAVDTGYTPDIIQQIKTVVGSKNIDFFNTTDDPDFKHSPATLLLMLDVLEHCENDQQVVKSVLEKLDTSEPLTVLITVPSFQSIFSNHDKVLGHYRRYSRKSLLSLCEKEGLTVIRSGYFFFSLLMIRWMQKWSERKSELQTNRSIDNWNVNNAITKIISAILWIDFRVSYFLSSLGLHLPGLSCYCLCKRSRS